MEGILISLDREEKRGRVDTQTEEHKELTIYFKEIPEGLQENDTVSFDVVMSQKSGRPYAKFLSPAGEAPAVPEAPEAPAVPEPLVSLEEESLLFEALQKFAEEFGPRLKIDLHFNPLLLDNSRVNGLCDFTHERYADLVLCNIPFFIAGRYQYAGAPYDPTYTVTLDKRYYDMRKRGFSDCDVYFRVKWTKLERDCGVLDGMQHGKDTWHTETLTVQPLDGVWKTSFSVLAKKVESGEVKLCSRYQPRDNEPPFFYLLNLNDPQVFERLL